MVMRFFAGLLRLAPPDTRFGPAQVNGEPALLTWVGASLVNVVAFEVADGLIQTIRVVANPDKLAYIDRQLKSGPALAR
jgi:RNA polymerase sigma-70 factor (ECF subfamily)